MLMLRHQCSECYQTVWTATADEELQFCPRCGGGAIKMIRREVFDDLCRCHREPTKESKRRKTLVLQA